jgi:RNA polymerase sigma factor (sigma-70 family)
LVTADDRELLAAWRAGDRRAGSELFDRHYRAVRRFFVNKVAAEQEVEELIQRTFMACVESVERFREHSSFRTWLLAIARNTFAEWVRERERERRHAHRPELGGIIHGPAQGVSTAFALRREQKLVLAALRSISLDSQLMLELMYWEQLTAREIGEVLAIPEGTARSRLRKAKLELRGALDGLARSAAELESTSAGLDDWARGLRNAWGE